MRLRTPCRVRGVAAAVLLLALPVHGTTAVTLPLSLDYGLLRQALAEHLFDGGEERLEISRDASGCNTLAIANPSVADGDAGRLALGFELAVTAGTPLAGRCRLALQWRGQVVLYEQARIEDPAGVISFRVLDSRLAGAGGRGGVPGLVWDGLKRFVHPRLEAFTVDLSALVAGSAQLREALLAESAPGTLAPVYLGEPAATVDGLEFTLHLDVPAALGTRGVPGPPLSPAELATWDRHWQAWDAFATWAISTLAREEHGALRHALLETLLDARYALRDVLVARHPGGDPVRALFVTTWQRLAPLVARAAGNRDTASALRYLAFTNAGEVIRALDAAAGAAGISLGREALLDFARTLDPAATADLLDYTQAPDPALRTLFALPPEAASPTALPTTSHDPPVRLRLWRTALAAPAVLAPERRLNGWIPQRHELDVYLHAVDALLGDILAAQGSPPRLPAALVPLHATVLRTTAWQESCWRQFVREGDAVLPISSSAGAVGLMQISRHVWRGLYDVDRLASDVAYNAAAGNEILLHYLIDYALRKKEDERSGDVENLARAVYAAYNGGPGQLTRYRQDGTPRALRAIDEAFWSKYQRMKRDGPAAVRGCYEGGGGH